MRAYPICLALLLIVACAGNSPPRSAESAPTADGWPRADLAASGFDSAAMQRLTQRLRDGVFAEVHMVLVEYDGRLVYEQYLSGNDEIWGTPVGPRDFDAGSLHDLRSISKTVTALLLGIALGDNFEAALQRPVLGYFPELAAAAAPGFEAVTLHQVLTMTTGQDWNEMDVPYSSWANDERRLYNKLDPIAYLLGKKIRKTPGETWYYNGGTTMLLAAVVEKVSGEPLMQFAERALFEPLGIEQSDVDWRGRGIWRQRPGLPSAASGLRLRGRDLAKIGSLMLNQGRWQGRQVVPAGWIRAAGQRHTEQTYPIWNHGGIYGYGYQVWHGNFESPAGDFSAVTGVGYGGQRLFVVPQRKIVVTVLAGRYRMWVKPLPEDILLEVIAAAPPP